MGNGVTWSVQNQSPETQFMTNGQTVTGKNVTFITSTGYVGTVFVDDLTYSKPDEVQKMIQSEVDKVTAVDNLTGGGE